MVILTVFQLNTGMINMNGCHSTIAPNRLQYDMVHHSKSNVNWPRSWPFVMTKTCQYIKQPGLVDHGCDGCKEKVKHTLHSQ